MTKEQHKRLRHALIAADNAFHASMRESGFTISYGLNAPHDGSIYDAQDQNIPCWPIGRIKIEWNINKYEEE